MLMNETPITDLKQCLLKLIEHLHNEGIIDCMAPDDLDSFTFSNIIVQLRDMLKDTYPNTKLKRMMKSIHYANGFSDMDLKQSAFILDEIEQYLSINKFLDHDASVDYFNKQITKDGFKIEQENLVLVMIESLLCSRRHN